MPDKFDFFRSTMTLLGIIFIPLVCGLGAGVLVFVVGFMFFLPKDNLAGLAPILWGGHAFLIVTFLASLRQIRRASTLPTWGGVVYALFLGLFLLLFLAVLFSFPLW